MSQMAGVTHGEGFTFPVCYLSLLEWVVCSFEKSQPDEMLMKFEAEMATQPWYRVLSGSPRTPACSVFPIAYYETWSSKSRVLLVTYGIAEHIMWHSFETLLKTTQDTPFSFSFRLWTAAKMYVSLSETQVPGSSGLISTRPQLFLWQSPALDTPVNICL